MSKNQVYDWFYSFKNSYICQRCWMFRSVQKKHLKLQTQGPNVDQHFYIHNVWCLCKNVQYDLRGGTMKNSFSTTTLLLLIMLCLCKNSQPIIVRLLSHTSILPKSITWFLLCYLLNSNWQWRGGDFITSERFQTTAGYKC
jgi:hypothetical protein